MDRQTGRQTQGQTKNCWPLEKSTKLKKKKRKNRIFCRIIQLYLLFSLWDTIFIMNVFYLYLFGNFWNSQNKWDYQLNGTRIFFNSFFLSTNVIFEPENHGIVDANNVNNLHNGIRLDYYNRIILFSCISSSKKWNHHENWELSPAIWKLT